MAKKKLVWIEDVRNQLVVPGRSKPLARSAFGLQLKKHGIVPQELPYEGTRRAYITEAQSAKVIEHYNLLHWRKLK
jgi:hypothetical protein